MPLRSLIKLVVVVGLFQIAAYFLAGSMASPEAVLAPAQPDTLLYCQAARRVAEGHPFSFSAGEVATTGTTSVLFPFVLALPYALGMKGDGLLVAGFFLNAVFYLVFLVGWSAAFARWASRASVAAVAALLLALSGQPAFCALSQSDIGFWLAVSGVLAYALSAQKPLLYGVLLVLSPWIRPEGMVCLIALGLILGVRFLLTRKLPKADLVILVLGLLSILSVFALNYALTGEAEFSSVARKGYFKLLSLPQAVLMTSRDCLQMVRSIFLALATGSPREFLCVPLLGGIFFCWGIFAYPWGKEGGWERAALFLAAAGGFVTVAMSGWQNTNVDRYLAWGMPVIYFLVAEGAVAAGRLVPSSRGKLLPAVVVCLYAAGAAVIYVNIFYCVSKQTDRLRAFALACERAMPQGASVGSFGNCGVAYYFSDRRLRHVGGIYSPEYGMWSDAARFETLRVRPETRFDYWFLEEGAVELVPQKYGKRMFGETVLEGPDGLRLTKADWRFYAAEPILPAGLTNCVASVEVGYDPEEKRARYACYDRYDREIDSPFLEYDETDACAGFDAARVIIGADRLTVPLLPGREALVVMRTKASVTQNGKVKTFANPLALNVEVDGEVIGQASLRLATNSFCEVTLRIPGEAIRKAETRIGFLGDHVACGYRFYQ